MIADGPPASPAVSVILATYNRSQALRHAVQSVCDSSFTDWELIVVGDACTDDTAECMASFTDPRIRFVNLAVRCGDQSGPNNHGITLSRGRYLAFLNHDDIYLPDHLATCVAELDRSGADLVWVPCAFASPKADVRAGDRPCTFSLIGVPPASGYSPYAFYFASSWVFRRSLVDRVGPWQHPKQEFVTPSQAWLFRAWRSGATLRFIPALTVILVPSGNRPGAYTRRDSPEHEWLARWLKDDPKCREHILEEAAVSEAMRRMSDPHPTPVRTIWRALLRPVRALLIATGIHPHSLDFAVRYGRRGNLVLDHRKRAGAR